jgi:hypothetical protein
MANSAARDVRKTVARLCAVAVLLAAGAIVPLLTGEDFRYTDEEAERFSARAAEVGGKPRAAGVIFAELGIEERRLRDPRVNMKNRGYWRTWRMSRGYDIVLYGDVYFPEGFFSVQIKRREV